MRLWPVRRAAPVPQVTAALSPPLAQARAEWDAGKKPV